MPPFPEIYTFLQTKMSTIATFKVDVNIHKVRRENPTSLISSKKVPRIILPGKKVPRIFLLGKKVP